MTSPDVNAQEPAHRTAPRRRRAAFVLFLASLYCLHIVPRPAPPYLFPLPRVDVDALLASAASHQALLKESEQRPLPHEVRVIGEQIRREGLGQAGPSPALLTDVKTALDKGMAPDLKRLRALQTEYFVRSAKAQDYSAPASQDLAELGGDFYRVAPLSWILGRSFILSDAELRLLFQVRWSKLTGTLDDPILGPSLADLRIYYSAMLRHPPLALGARGGELALARQPIISGAAAVDPEYPLGLATGLNLLTEGRAELASLALESEIASGRRAARSLRLAHHRALAASLSEAP